MRELHEGICSLLSGRQSCATKAHVGYYWPTLRGDAVDFTKRCRRCQGFTDVPCTPLDNFHSLSSPWPFAMWGMDILGPLPKAPGAVKYLLVPIDYFTKWIETRPLWEITASELEKFTWKHLICRYGLPYLNSKLRLTKPSWQRLGDKHLVTSVEHPQTNGQAEAANRVILRALCSRLNKSKGLW